MLERAVRKLHHSLFEELGKQAAGMREEAFDSRFSPMNQDGCICGRREGPYINFFDGISFVLSDTWNILL
jgi:hypothetical protein